MPRLHAGASFSPKEITPIMSSDAIVTSRDVLSALMELRRVGHTRVMHQIEELEPDNSFWNSACGPGMSGG